MADLGDVIARLARDPSLVEQLRTAPEELASKFDLAPDDISALRGADLLLVARPRSPFAGAGTTTYTFVTGSTITGRFGRDDLIRLPRERLVEVLERAVTDREFAAELRGAFER